MALPNKHTELVVVSYHLRGLQTLSITFLDWLACSACDDELLYSDLTYCVCTFNVHTSIHCKNSGYLECRLYSCTVGERRSETCTTGA